MTIEAITIIAKTTVDLANVGIVGYGIYAAKEFLLNWLNSFPRRDFRTPQQVQQDAEVTN